MLLISEEIHSFIRNLFRLFRFCHRKQKFIRSEHSNGMRIQINMKEYEDTAIKVGNKITIEIKKSG